MRCAVKYGRAIEHAIGLAKYIRTVNEAAGRPFELELSIDETRQPTSLAEHYIIADQFREQGLKLISIAPKFIGEFEKGVDYKGDIGELERSLADHAALARELGPYKLSLHSGSDKLSLYPILARTTNGCFHVKTAGTSYLGGIARRRPARRVAVPPRDRSRAPALRPRQSDLSRKRRHQQAAKLRAMCATSSNSRKYISNAGPTCPAGKGFTAPGRQVLHCTFGTMLMDPELGPSIRQLLEMHADTYTEVLADHFERHLRALS